MLKEYVSTSILLFFDNAIDALWFVKIIFLFKAWLHLINEDLQEI